MAALLCSLPKSIVNRPAAYVVKMLELVKDDKVSLVNKNALPTNNFSSQAISILKENSGRYVEGRWKMT